jgi:hypothetical protein
LLTVRDVSKSPHTQFWTGGRTRSAWPAEPLVECPECKAPTPGRLFCARDGTLVAAGPFSVADRYLVEERLGAGGTALVFGARHQLLGKPVALKVLRPELAGDAVESQRFLRAARIASQLHHESIVSIIDLGRDEKLDLSFLVMERLWGQTLAEVIAAGAPAPESRAAACGSTAPRASSSARARSWCRP